MIAIHNSKLDFHPRWISYCEKKNIPYRLVDCYENNIIRQLAGCDTLMWHFHQNNPKDILFAKQLMFSLQQAGIKVFPDFNTAWHFDDKVGQKYLLEAISESFARSWVFYDKKKALAWADNASFPKVFKLRGGAGSQNVRLVKSKKQATKLINRAFNKGFSNYNAWDSLKERLRKYKLHKASLFEVIKGAVRLVYPPPYTKVLGREVGYVYFQEYYKGNDSDTRIIVVGDKAFALKRMVRTNDFRASGSGSINYSKEEIDERCVKNAFMINRELNAQCIAYDYVFDSNNDIVLIEVSFGFSAGAYDDCEGYWDKEFNWYPGKFNPYGWMVDLMK